VRTYFRRYDLLDEQVEFLPGWFRETLPNAPVKQLALLRIDGDMYESTIVTSARSIRGSHPAAT
jgi:O-methyltransferase